MNDLESRIQDVLNDPEQMAQIMQMAESLGLHPNETESPHPLPAENNKRAALMDALLPYLPPEKQKRLQRALKIGKLSQIAGFALLQSQETE